jgi:hypothetical protein
MWLVNTGSAVKYTFDPFMAPNVNPAPLKFTVAPFTSLLESDANRIAAPPVP